MKKIYSFLFTVLALFAFAPVLSSQTINETITDPKTGATLEFPKAKPLNTKNSGVAYSKNISSPLSDGTYYIKLETFATGSAHKILSSTPSDIILILDSSTSMDQEDYGGTSTYTAVNSGNPRGYSYNSYTTTYYYLYDGEYYPVSRGGNAQNEVRYLTFTDNNGKTWYLNNYAGYTGRANLNNTYYTDGDGLMENQPTMDNSNGPLNNSNLGIWEGVLYQKNTTGQVSRLSALQEATNKFIENIWQNDHDVTEQDSSYPGNRIAIITYDNNAYTLESNGNWRQDGTAAWFDIGAQGVRTTLENAVDDIDTHNWTQPGLGMAEAISDLLSGSTEATSKREDANLVVVMFTDGVPANASTGGSGNTFGGDVANQAINYGYQLKQTYGATLFTVGLIDPYSNNDNLRKGRYFLDLLSSNYPKSQISATSTNAWTTGSDGTLTVNGLTVGTHDEDGNYYQLVDDNTDLTSIFDAISKQSGGSSNTSLSAATSNVDVISNSFILPEGADADHIEDYVLIFTAKLASMSVDANNKLTYTFEPEILAPNNPGTYNTYDEDGNLIDENLPVDDNIGVELVGENGISVTGFDYSSNWCGPVFPEGYTPHDPITAEDLTHATFQGYKIFIMIPIKMNPDAVGGPNVSTNGDGSGIYIDDSEEPLIPFESPAVSLPVNIYIKKIGLEPGESAKFSIERAEIPYDDDGNWDIDDISEEDWHYVSTVFVTMDENATSSSPDPIVKVKGLPANIMKGNVEVDVVYRIAEEPWGWSYEAGTGNEDPQYTVTSKVDNPFEFKNKKQEDIEFKVRHAESKATNSFDPADPTVKYDDSKNSKNRKTYTETESESGTGTE